MRTGTVSEMKSEMCDAIATLARVTSIAATAMDVTMNDVQGITALCLKATDAPVRFAEVALRMEAGSWI